MDIKSITAASDWIVLNPKPTINTGLDITFINSQKGFLITATELFTTQNAGESWEKLMNITSGKRIVFKNNIGYIVGNNGTIYKSTPFGEEWNKLSVSFTENLNSITVLHPDTLRITSDTRLFSSNDGGQTWNSYNISSVNIEDSYFTSSDTGHIACTSGKILKTTDGGVRWKVKFTTNSIPSDFFRIIFVNSEVGYASMQHAEIKKTIDGGETWTQMAQLDAAYGMCFLNENIGFIAGHTGAILKTTDGGVTWVYKGFDVRKYGNDLYSIFFTDENTGFATGMNGRIIKTMNSGTIWTEYTLTYNDIIQVQFTSLQTGYALARGKLYKTVDQGTNWISLGSMNSGISLIAMDFITDNSGFIGGGNSILKTTDGGITWIPAGNISGTSIDFVDENTGYISGGSTNATYKTTNGGQDWQKIASYSFTHIQFLNAQTGYALNTYNSYDRIYKTTDGGATWVSKFETEDDINSFYFIDENNGFIAGDYALISKTSDGGTTWRYLSPIISFASYTKIRFFNNNIGYMLDDDGNLLQTSDGGLIWESIFSHPDIKSIELKGNDIFIWGVGGKILKNIVQYDPVSVHVVPIKNPMSHKATLKGIVASNSNDITDIQFQYSIDTDFGNSVSTNPSVIYKYESDSVFADISGLKANTKYYYRIKAICNEVEYLSDYSTFRTPLEYEIFPNGISGVSSSGADLSGIVNSYDAEITGVRFYYGTDTLCSSFVDASPNMVAGGIQKNVFSILTGLQPETKYYVRIKAYYKEKVIRSSTTSFTTLPEYQFFLYYISIAGSSASVVMLSNSNNGVIDNIVIEYGKTREYLSSVSTAPNIIDFNSAAMLQATLTGLESNTVYFFRIKAKQGSKIIYSSENVFKLEGGIIIVPAGVLQVSDNSVILNGLIDPYGSFLNKIQFEYSTTEAFSSFISASPASLSGTKTLGIKASLNNLLPGTKYYFRIKASEGTNIYYSEISEFTMGVVTGTGKEHDFNDLKIYPNPVSDILTIKSDFPVDRIEIYDQDGILIKSTIKTTSVDISGYKDGFYFIRIYTNGHIHVRKIIVSK